MEVNEPAAQDYVSSRRLSPQYLPNKISPLDRQGYVSSGVQTNLGRTEDWYESSLNQIPRPKHHISLTKRLLLRCQKDRERLEAERSISSAILHENPGADLKSLSFGETEGGESSRPIKTSSSNEVEMEDITHHSDQPEEIDKREIPHDHVAKPGSVPSSLPVQKPRPPDQQESIANLTLITEIHHAPPVPTTLPPFPPTLTARNHHVNGFHPNDMRVQPPSVPSIPQESTLDSFSVHNRSSIPPLSPLMQISSNQPNSSPAYSCGSVHSTPVKKKISVGEYNILFRRKAESQSTSDKSQNFGAVLQQNLPRAAPVLKGISKIAADDGTDVNTAMKDLTS